VAALGIPGVGVVTETRAAHNPVNDLVGQYAGAGGAGGPSGLPSLMAIQAAPKRIPDHKATAVRLAGVLGTPAEDIEAVLDKRPSFLFVERKISPSVAERVRALNIVGISLIPEDKRVYPKGAFAPQLLGSVDTDNGGVAGLEKQYDPSLKGEAGTRTILKDPRGRSLDVVMDRAERPGSPLSLTIDEDIQFTTEQVLTEAVKTYGAKRATAIVLNPGNGDILAMANTPVFDANAFGKATLEAQRNMAVNDLYEPGSTFKMVVVATALEMGLVQPDTSFSLPKTLVVGGRTIHESHEDTIPDVRELTVREILAQSSNIGAVTLGLEVGKAKLVDMIRRFGFGRPLGIDFPGEGAGLLLPAKKWSASTIGNVPMGQGISTTPLQMACAYAAIANDGVMVQPHLAKAADMTSQRRVVSSTIAAELRSMLTWTVKGGTGKAAEVQGYEVAGKTGTAQKVQQGGG
jgi:cell division protein FtsI/penicillin-binding protein 2